jgi:nitroimidazol reductase NimA-like FMN-containing flavoprotein (pyridoxamine 5'-phosphate oxidase superfamily)
MEPEMRTERSTVRRNPVRAVYDRERIDAILDEALICHAGFVIDGEPRVLPTIHARIGNRLVMHGAASNAMLGAMRSGAPVCVTVTILDGLVLARSAFRHSMNYRSAVIFGRARSLERESEKLAALRAIVEHVMPGRWDDARPPSAEELAATLVMEVEIEEASAKIRTGPPGDKEADLALPVWAGEIPLRLAACAPIAAPGVDSALAPPDYVVEYVRVSRAAAELVSPCGREGDMTPEALSERNHEQE